MSAHVRDVSTLVEFAPTDPQLIITALRDQSKGTIYVVPNISSSSNNSAAALNRIHSRHSVLRRSTAETQPRYTISRPFAIIYCLMISTVGVFLPYVYLFGITNTTGSYIGYNSYHIFLIFLFVTSILLQCLMVLRKLTESCCGRWSSNSSQDADVEVPQRSHGAMVDPLPFGSVSFRLIVSSLGVATSLELLLEFAWRLDVVRLYNIPQCKQIRIEIATYGLALLHALLHLYTVFFNAKLFLPSYQTLYAFGVLHLAACDITSWAWLGSTYMLISSRSYNVSKTDPFLCAKLSSLSTVAFDVVPYLGLCSLTFFILSFCLLVSMFWHFFRNRTFFGRSKLDDMMKNTSHRFACNANWAGLVLGVVILTGCILLVTYHYVLISWGKPHSAWIATESVSLVLSTIALILTAMFLGRQTFSLERLKRSIGLETMTLLIAALGIYIYSLSYAMASLSSLSLPTGSYISRWAVAAMVVQVIEVTVQTGVLLCALKTYARFLPVPAFRLQQSLTLYFAVYNLVMVVFCFVRQYDAIYGTVFRQSLGVWFWVLSQFVFNSGSVMYRLFSAAAFRELWSRAFVID